MRYCIIRTHSLSVSSTSDMSQWFLKRGFARWKTPSWKCSWLWEQLVLLVCGGGWGGGLYHSMHHHLTQTASRLQWPKLQSCICTPSSLVTGLSWSPHSVLPEDCSTTGKFSGREQNVCDDGQGVVTYMSRVEAFLTGIKIESSDQNLFSEPIKGSR